MPINGFEKHNRMLRRQERDKAKAEAFYLRASMRLADANALAERGKKAKAERLYGVAQFWLDKANRAAGNS